jgi:hypothetical protein
MYSPVGKCEDFIKIKKMQKNVLTSSENIQYLP